MTLLYFDGFDQYVDVPAATTLAPCSYVRGVSNQTAVSTDPSVYMNLSAVGSYCKLYGEDRVWRIPTPNIGANAFGSHQYQHDRSNPFFTRSDSSYGITLDSRQTVTQQKKLVVGFKIKHADNQYRYYSSNQFNLPLAVFSSTSTFQTEYSTWAVVLGVNNTVSIRPMRTNGSYGYTFNELGQAWPTGWWTTGDNPVLGPCNFVYGTCQNNNTSTVACVPPIEQLAANTVEIEVTDTGKVSVWINNQFIGSCTFGPAMSYITNVQYVKVGLLPSYYTSSTGTTPFNVFSGITDLYLLNGMGTTNNKRLGKVKVLSRRPVSDSAVQFVRPDTANSNAEVASSVPPLFGKSLTGVKVGDTDLYASTAFNFTNEAILGASVVTTGYKTDPSGNDIAPVIKVGGTTYPGNTNIVPISASLMKTEQSIYELNPKTNLPFTKSDLDASTFGVTVVAPVVV